MSLIIAEIRLRCEGHLGHIGKQKNYCNIIHIKVLHDRRKKILCELYYRSATGCLNTILQHFSLRPFGSCTCKDDIKTDPREIVCSERFSDGCDGLWVPCAVESVNRSKASKNALLASFHFS
jgi:hypothetical protein